jgi:hypothetical protein
MITLFVLGAVIVFVFMFVFVSALATPKQNPITVKSRDINKRKFGQGGWH